MLLETSVAQGFLHAIGTHLLEFVVIAVLQLRSGRLCSGPIRSSVLWEGFAL